jgi:hypothetical protein
VLLYLSEYARPSFHPQQERWLDDEQVALGNLTGGGHFHNKQRFTHAEAIMTD